MFLPVLDCAVQRPPNLRKVAKMGYLTIICTGVVVMRLVHLKLLQELNFVVSAHLNGLTRTNVKTIQNQYCFSA